MRKKKLKEGDLVRYVATHKRHWGEGEEEAYAYDLKQMKKYIGRIYVITDVIIDEVALGRVTGLTEGGPLPYDAWYYSDEVEPVILKDLDYVKES